MFSATQIDGLLASIKRGDSKASEELIAAVYRDLLLLARRYMRGERVDHTLQPTALVHETYLRLLSEKAAEFSDRAHFFGAASTVMRRILVDHARKRGSLKRSAGAQKVKIEQASTPVFPDYDSMLLLDQALNRLAQWDSRQSRLVEMMYFGGLTEQDAAEVLGISVRTVHRDWRAARAWLQAELSTDLQTQRGFSSASAR
jgi:RNA polymerase sigma factor (TIGR02999 family)